MFVSSALLLLWHGGLTNASSSVEYLSLIQDYALNVRGFHHLTIISCSPPWTRSTTTTDNFFVQFLDQSQDEFNISTLKSRPNCRQLITLDLRCPQSLHTIRSLSLNHLFNSHCHAHLLLNPREDPLWHFRQLQPVLTEVDDFSFTSNVVLATRHPVDQLGEDLTTESHPEWFIYDIWSPSRRHGGSLKTSLIAYYDKSNEYHELNFSSSTTAIQRRMNLSEIHLQCAIVVTSPFNDTLEQYITHNYDPYLDTVHRLNFRTIGLVQQLYNFHLHVKRTHSWGYIQNVSSTTTTTFDGMIGMLQRGEVDFGCSPAWFRTERLQVVDYGAQTWAIRPIFLFRHPNTRGLGRNVFLEPFEDSVWVVLLASSAVIIVLMSQAIQQDAEMFSVQSKGETSQSKKTRISRISSRILLHLRSIAHGARLYVTIILQQGVTVTEEGHLFSSRLSTFLLFSHSFLLLQFYSASIVGSLLMTPPKTIRTIPDLTASRLAVGIQDIVYNYDFFKYTTDQNALQLYEKKVKHLDKSTGNVSLNFFSVDEGLRRLQHEAFAFHVDLDYVFERIVHTFNEKDICDLTMIYLYAQQPMGNVFPKASAIRAALSYGIHRIREAGLFAREKRLWITEAPACTRQIQTDDLQVELFPLRSLFALLLAGIGLSLLILLAEMLMHKLQRDSRVE